MRNIFYIVYILFLFIPFAYGDTPPPGTVKAKMFSGDGATGFTATGTALDVNITNASGLTTVNQGAAGLDPWLVHFNNSSLPVTGTFWQATQPVSGTLTCNAGSGTQAVSLATLPALTTGSATIGAVNINGTIPVTGTFTNPSNGDTGAAVPDQATQIGGVDGSGDLRALKVSNVGVLSVDASGSTVPISAASLPLPTGAATDSGLSTINTTLGSPMQQTGGSVTADAGSGTFTVDASGHTVPVSGTFWQATQPVSAASLPLPSGAATSAKQPALGTAGSASSDVITVQGITSMTPLLVNGSGFTQPVSGTFWQATQPISGTVTANAGTGTLNVSVTNASLAVTGTFWQATQPISGTVTANIGSSGSLALDASVTGLQVSQGSTTSGQKGGLTLGAVTTAAPSYTTAQSSPLSLTAAGALRVDGSATTQPVSGTFWQATQPVSLASLPALVAGTAIIGKVGIDQTTPGTTNGVQVNAALPAGSNVIGHVIVDTAPTTAVTQSGTWTVQPGNTANTTAWLVNAVPKTPTATTVKAAAITIGTSAVRLTNDGSVPPATRVLLIAQLLSTSTANCFLGPSTVTSSGATRGAQMFAGQSFSFNNDAGDYYAICDASAQTFYITEQE